MQAFKKKINLFLTVFFGLPLAIIIKLLNPFVVIRVGRFHASRIGHFALDFGLYLSRKSLAKKKKLQIPLKLMQLSLYIINKAGGLVYHYEQQKNVNLTSNDHLRLASTFHSMYAIARLVRTTFFSLFFGTEKGF